MPRLMAASTAALPETISVLLFAGHTSTYGKLGISSRPAPGAALDDA